MKTPLTKLLVASTNDKKLKELRELLGDLSLSLVGLNDYHEYQEVPEDGTTFEENAAIKAQGYARQMGLLTLAEDSGLCCDALQGAPGVMSARYAGLKKDDLENNRKVLELMRDVPDEHRNAMFVSVIALALPKEVIGIARGEVHGFISKEERGDQGFGYDPIFFFPDYGKTFGEVDSELKHKVSHRAQALKKTKQLLATFLNGMSET